MQNPESMKDYRPISLCNVVYKIIAKVLANRLKKILPYIISESQSAFVPGRLISDNILIAFETLHHMKFMKGGQQSYMALKLDMSKAYDRVEWAFLEAIMMKMGFNASWVSMIMECVRSVSYYVLINGDLYIINPLFFIECSKLNTFPEAPLWKLDAPLGHPLLGKVFFKLGK